MPPPWQDSGDDPMRMAFGAVVSCLNGRLDQSGVAMALARMKPQDGVAWITGASSGIGAAVALELARRGWTVAITARRLELLEEVALQGAGLSGRIVAHAGNVTDPEAMRAVVEGIESVHGPIALAFLNAGTAQGNRPDGLDAATFERIFAVNL